MAGVLFAPTAAFSERVVDSLPLEEKFDSNDYEGDLVWTTNGAHEEWVPNGGWRGTGAAKFYPPTVEGVSGLGQFVEINNGQGVEQLNVRFLIYHGRDWDRVTAYNKVVIMNRIDDYARPMIISRNHNGWRTYGSCDNTVCNYEGGDFWPDGTDSFRIGDRPENREEEWISVELEANMMTGKIKVYVYTQDGDLAGLYTETTMKERPRSQPDLPAVIGPGTPLMHYIDMIGGYFNDPPTTPHYTSDTYFMIDELKVDDSYIGPPEGFVDGGNESQLRIEIDGRSASYELLPFGGSAQDIEGTANIMNNGTTLRLVGNTWKRVELGNIDITANTILEFDFSSSSEGEIHGIGFDHNNYPSSASVFKLHGTQNSFGRLNYDNYSGTGTKHYRIPVGEHFTGTLSEMVFVMDHDVENPSGESVFSNVRVYESQ